MVIACGPAVSGTSDGDSGTSDGTDGGDSLSGGGPGGDGNPTTGSTTSSATTGATTSAGVTSDATSAGTTTDGSGSTGGGSICDGRNDLYTCSQPNDCGQVDCGDYLSPWDADGCLRPACDQNGACPEGMACLRPFEWGGCLSSDPVACADQGDECICRGSSLPDCGGGICIPESALPPAACGDFDNEQECAEMGCSWATVSPVLNDAESYACGMSVGTCLWFPEGNGGDDIRTPYLRWEGSTAEFPTGWAVFGASYDVPPLGWTACGGPGPMSDVCTWWSDGPDC